MCGIAGIWSFKNKLAEEKLKRFTDSMYHRGPDGAGYDFFDNNSLGFGHRRLSILDLTDSGKQPMSYSDGRYWITYNGEIFNFPEIKHELEQKGIKFKSETDTEVILASFAEWGKECLDKFNGMWAFAIWDKVKEELFISRDRFGVKPLYYINKENENFVFASETRAFKYLDDYKREFDDKLVDLVLEDSYALEGLGYTPFKDIFQLLPGHYMIVKKGKPIIQKRWWHIENHLHKEVPKTLKEQAEKFYEILRDACKIRLISDVPVATALSGGLDSSTVYSIVYDLLLNENLGRINLDSQRAFSAIFPGLPNNEKEYADLAASFVGSKVNYIETDFTNLGKQIEQDTEMCDFISTSPITSISAIYKGMRENGVVVSMDGHGVDEMLYGYRDMVYSLFNYYLFKGDNAKRDEIKNVLTETYHPDNRESLSQRLENNINSNAGMFSGGKRLLKSIARKIIKPDIDRKLGYLPLEMPKKLGEPYDFSNKSLEDRMVYHEFFEHCLPSLLRNFDRASMMNSIEIRMPFMDWRLITYVFSLPVNSKIGQGFTKLLVREAMKGKMDETVRTRTFKVGIGSPVEHWFNGTLKEWVLDSINDNQTKEELLKAYNSGGLSSKQVTQTWLELNLKMLK